VNIYQTKFNNTEDEEDEDFINITDDMLDPEKDDIIPALVQHKVAGIPRSIRFLTSFYNPNPQDEWENIRG
jgi:hypothetical protein